MLHRGYPHHLSRWRGTPLAVVAMLALALGACSQPSGGAPASKPAAPAPSGQAAAPTTAPQAQPAAGGNPVEIRVGHGFAAEENLWLMAARPDVTPNQGKAYRLTMTAFRGNADRLNGFDSGQLIGTLARRSASSTSSRPPSCGPAPPSRAPA